MLDFAVLVSPTPQHRDTTTPRTRTSDSDMFFATKKNTVFKDTGVNGTASIAEQAAVALSGSQQSSKVHDAAQLCGNSDTISTANTATMNGRRLHTRSRSTYSW
ncbi:hypothetical protein HBI81_064040 [Parastagonospora nodorum]|nr:hypothetical protein HBI09_078930 [Parastagonospora nodorum]KAH4286156.1 hypothetical protein HBI01_241460 [Parastagonospora nodorum]KAH4291477.1 hypothetical protein HBI02_194540 [Parastagonospora nodorum]KAH4736370.1 hypothetical protein HBH64_242030 [Parastagonospora nodorum]KAH5054013.1 hypothetical protein HBI73_226270 [Parastagonospora nodorum]